MTGRKIIIGDVHGCLYTLHALLRRVRHNWERDALYMVGDLVNRGPFSKEVLKFVASEGILTVKGNHEVKLQKALKKGYSRHEKITELTVTLKPKKWLPWLAALPLYLDEDEFLLVHAGLAPGVRLDKQKESVVTQIRTWDGSGKDLKNPANPPWFDFYQGEKPVVFGHWSELGPFVTGNLACIDSGCVYGRGLSALVMPDYRLVSIPTDRRDL